MYNRAAGRSLERLAGLSDGVSAVAMTLLVLDLRVPIASGSTASATSHELFSIISTYCSIGLIVALQLNYALGLRWPSALAH